MVKTVLKIDGMACGMCEAHVNETVRSFCRVKKVTSSYKTGECTVLSEEPLDTEGLKSAVSDTGYRITGVSVSDAPDSKGFFARLLGKRK